MNHDAQLILVIGSPGTGKTYLINKLCVATRRRTVFYNPYVLISDIRKMRVISTNANVLKTAKGINQITGKEPPPHEVIEMLRNSFVNGNIVLDDAGHFMSLHRGKAEEAVKSLIIARRHIKSHVFLTFHDLNEVPAFVFRYTINMLVLFPFASDPTQWSDKIPHRDRILGAYKLLIEKLKKRTAYAHVAISLEMG